MKKGWFLELEITEIQQKIKDQEEKYITWHIKYQQTKTAHPKCTIFG